MNVWTVSRMQETYCDGTFSVLLSIHSTEEKAREAVAKYAAEQELEEDDYWIYKELLDK